MKIFRPFLILLGGLMTTFSFSQENRGSFESLFSVRGEYRQVTSTKLFTLPSLYYVGDLDVRAWGGFNLTENSKLTSGFSLTKDFPLSKSGSVKGFAGLFWVAAEPNLKPFSDWGTHVGLEWHW